LWPRNRKRHLRPKVQPAIARLSLAGTTKAHDLLWALRYLPGTRRRKQVKRTLRYATLVLVLVVVLFPIYWMVLDTFQPPSDSLKWPPPFFFTGINFGVFVSIFKYTPLATWLLHSIEVSAVTVAVTAVLVVPGAFVLSQLRWRGRTAFGWLLLFTQLLPGALIIVPELEWYRTLNWTNNLLALGLLYAAFTAPLGCWILKTAFDNVPTELVQACFVEGGTPLGTLRWVLLPLSRGALVAALVVAFLAGWNDYLFASALITKINLYTAGLGMAELIGGADQAVAAGLIFSIIPVALYLFLQRHIARGFTAGVLR
jgi:multiple sugar transport system permease protein